MTRCTYCARTFRIGGLQEQLSKIYVHVMARHPNASDNRQDWYREENDNVADEQPPQRPALDAGDVATKAKWELACQGVVVIALRDGQAHFGVSGLSPAQIRELACVAIKAAYALQEQAANVRTNLVVT